MKCQEIRTGQWLKTVKILEVSGRLPYQIQFMGLFYSSKLATNIHYIFSLQYNRSKISQELRSNFKINITLKMLHNKCCFLSISLAEFLRQPFPFVGLMLNHSLSQSGQAIYSLRCMGTHNPSTLAQLQCAYRRSSRTSCCN